MQFDTKPLIRLRDNTTYTMNVRTTYFCMVLYTCAFYYSSLHQRNTERQTDETQNKIVAILFSGQTGVPCLLFFQAQISSFQWGINQKEL